MSYNSSRGGSFLGSIPDITKNLLIINVLMWIATMALQTRGVHLDKWFALHFWQAGDFMPWQIVTYMVYARLLQRAGWLAPLVLQHV